MLLADVEGTIAREGLTLGLASMPAQTVAAWLAAGAPGAPSSFADPADHLLAGLTEEQWATPSLCAAQM